MLEQIVVLGALIAAAAGPAAPAPAPAGEARPAEAIALPGAPADGVALDYLAVDRARNRVWVPAGGTGSTVVIDATTRQVSKVEGFPTREIERAGKKRLVGPSSATVGDGFVYVGDRADSSICAIDAATLQRGGCVTLGGSPDGLAFIGRTKEVWVTTPRDQSIVILDVSRPSAPALAGSLKLEGSPEGYAIDADRGMFYTNLEDRNRTLRIDAAARKVVATWTPGCGESGPRGLAIEPKEQALMVACTDHVEVLDAAGEGRVLSRLETGAGVDNLDYLPDRRFLYAAAAGAGTLTVAHLDGKGALQRIASIATARGARNAVVSASGTVFVADGPGGRILVVSGVPADR